MGVLAFGSAPALAAQRYATPSGTAVACTQATPCSLATAIEGAAKGDEVIVEPGSYGTSETPLSAAIESGTEDLDVHGVDSAPGPPGARVFTDAVYGIVLYGAGATIRDLEIVDSGSSNGGALALEGGASGQQLTVRSVASEGNACYLETTSTLSDSLCQDSSSFAAASAVHVSGVLDGPNNVALRNVTAIESSANGVGIRVESDSPPSRPSTLTAINTIARGGADDILVAKFTEAASVVTSHSNYSAAKIQLENGATITDDGTSQTTGVQGPTELFVDPATGDFREALGAQTIGAGLIAPLNGVLDFEGDARVFAEPTNCASTDIGADQFVPASGPSVTIAPASAVGQTGATLGGTANPLGGAGAVHFDYGAAAPGGGPPTSFSSTPTQCLAIGDAAQAATATLTGLEPGTTYYYRLVAGNANATTTPAFTATFTTSMTPSIATPPRLTGVQESAKRWREGNALAHISAKNNGRRKRKLPVGTTFSFALNEPASVTFTFTEPANGRKVGKKCVAQTKKNKRKHRRCTRTVVAGTLTFSAHTGTNKLRFEGRISKHKKLKPGSYSLVVSATASGEHATASTLHFTIAQS